MTFIWTSTFSVRIRAVCLHWFGLWAYRCLLFCLLFSLRNPVWEKQAPTTSVKGKQGGSFWHLAALLSFHQLRGCLWKDRLLDGYLLWCEGPRCCGELDFLKAMGMLVLHQPSQPFPWNPNVYRVYRVILMLQLMMSGCCSAPSPCVISQLGSIQMALRSWRVHKQTLTFRQNRGKKPCSSCRHELLFLPRGFVSSG